MNKDDFRLSHRLEISFIPNINPLLPKFEIVKDFHLAEERTDGWGAT